jgi:hypothetical protein
MTKTDNSGRQSSDGISLGIHPECLFFRLDFIMIEDFLRRPPILAELRFDLLPSLKIVASFYCRHQPSMGPGRSDEPEYTTEGS